MRQCQCGGVQREHELTDGRTAYTCAQCGRYQALAPRASDVKPVPQEAITRALWVLGDFVNARTDA